MTLLEAPPKRGSYHVFTLPGQNGHPGEEGMLRVGALLRRSLLAVVCFFILVITATLLIAMSPTLSRSLTAFFIRSQPGAVPWNGTDPVNVLMVGLDRRPGQTGPSNTDTMMVVSVNPSTNSVRMFSIPRDLWVNIPGWGYDRVNAALPKRGKAVMMRTVEGIVNLPIRYYAIINFTNFQRVVDALGCVTIDVKTAIDDPTYPAPRGSGFAPLHIRKGVQRMCGKLALEYVRTRHDDPLGDLGRNLRQQQLLEAMKSQALTPATIVRLPLILDALGRSVNTNFPYVDLTYLARLIMTGHTHRMALNYANNAVSNYTTPNQSEVLLPNWPRIHWLAHLMFADPRMGESGVEILNGSGQPGQASALAHWMKACGFKIQTVGNAGRSNYAHSQVIRNSAVTGSSFVARMAGDLLQTKVTTRRIQHDDAPILVIVGQDWTTPVQS